MHPSESARLRREWGDQPCSHPETVKELSTGDYVCTHCGEATWGKSFDDEN